MRMLTLLGFLAVCVLTGLLFFERNTLALQPGPAPCKADAPCPAVQPHEQKLALCKAAMKQRGHDGKPRMHFGFCYIDALTPGLHATLLAGAQALRPPPVLEQYVGLALADFNREHPAADPATIDSTRQALIAEFNALWPLIKTDPTPEAPAQGGHIVQTLRRFNEHWWSEHAERFHDHLRTTQRLCQSHPNSCVMGNYN
ncbi:hypothetical protein [Pseudomonas sp. RIT623]|uniref:hypothetical protein n=1 Tax=Pseudomonas sp. RIT623 TaxID=2559075 RepID=UPI0010700136|nr:hypothetical protein [Pseudomonas sp. RIT623]TFF41946.1 hypothetical protein E3U47_07615 [Pseudomonas sp. RIT623]